MGEPRGNPEGAPGEPQLTNPIVIRFIIYQMPSKDTIPFHITKTTAEEIEKIRKRIAKDLGIPIDTITKKHGEIAMRVKSQRGRLLIDELNKILLGQIK